MPRPAPRAAHAGGFLIAAGVVIGAVAGSALHEPTIGVLLGFAISAGLALALWLRERGRT